MHNKVVYRLARGLRRAGIVVLRFNFRGVGRSAGEHAHLEGEIEDARAALGWLRERYPGLPYCLAGFSFGARVITRLGCAAGDASFLMAAGFPTRWGPPEYLENCTARKIFIQSTNDVYGPQGGTGGAVRALRGPQRIALGGGCRPLFRGCVGGVGREGEGVGGGNLEFASRRCPTLLYSRGSDLGQRIGAAPSASSDRSLNPFYNPTAIVSS